MAPVRENQMVFALAPSQGAGNPTLFLGVPKAAWEYMKYGMAHTFDLTSIGLPIKLVVYGAATHDAAMKVITDHCAKAGVTMLDERRKDFSINADKQG